MPSGHAAPTGFPAVAEAINGRYASSASVAATIFWSRTLTSAKRLAAISARSVGVAFDQSPEIGEESGGLDADRLFVRFCRSTFESLHARAWLAELDGWRAKAGQEIVSAAD
jgi:hypothetical protein